jgi:biotin synthase
MNVNLRAMQILNDAQEGKSTSQVDCIFLLQFHETSLEASLMRTLADSVSRKRFRNNCILLGQIGIEIAACPGKCGFCSFAEGHALLTPSRMSDADILNSVGTFTESHELYALFLMTMHTFSFGSLIQTVHTVREHIPAGMQIVVNIGDFDRVQAMELKSAGVDGAYHVCRLREGIDTAIAPEQRKATIRNIKDSGMDWYYCCEPIGPEHTPEELAEQIFLGIEYGCFQHAAMRRVSIPSSPLAHQGQITELRLAQIVAIVTLATIHCMELQSIAVHEPNLLGLTSGANTIYAETGANPRDTKEDTAGHRGRDIDACRRMLHEAGFDNLLVSAGKCRPLVDLSRQ